ncbi:hypothetical protein [Blautia acetigignens]|uniref:RHS repeat protein n=1 Tax=Blautia acetigignens TaxID=2981783 RepID=A0ABV1CH25_9FIRM
MYLRNAQNDIIGLLDKDGKAVVRYTYDSWKPVCITAVAVTTILRSAGSSARMTHRF